MNQGGVASLAALKEICGGSTIDAAYSLVACLCESCAWVQVRGPLPGHAPATLVLEHVPQPCEVRGGEGVQGGGAHTQRHCLHTVHGHCPHGGPQRQAVQVRAWNLFACGDCATSLR